MGWNSRLKWLPFVSSDKANKSDGTSLVNILQCNYSCLLLKLESTVANIYHIQESLGMLMLGETLE